MIVILEDYGPRIAAMNVVLRESLCRVPFVFIEDAHEAIAHLGEHLPEIDLISLDHDLPIRRDAENRLIDCGTGREVADYLAKLPPTCPVIVHSSNVTCADAMTIVLRDAGWPCKRVHPRDDLAWIRDEWTQAVRDYIRDGWISTPDSSAG